MVFNTGDDEIVVEKREVRKREGMGYAHQLKLNRQKKDPVPLLL